MDMKNKARPVPQPEQDIDTPIPEGNPNVHKTSCFSPEMHIDDPIFEDDDDFMLTNRISADDSQVPKVSALDQFFES